MRINKFIAQATGMSRRAADNVLSHNRVAVNQHPAQIGREIDPLTDVVCLDGKVLQLPDQPVTVLLNKPTGYVCSRDGQGSSTVYDLLPNELHRLKPVGRLDKDSSGLLLMTNDGDLAERLSHPRYGKSKRYTVTLNRPLTSVEIEKITGQGIDIGDERPSSFALTKKGENTYEVVLTEGRNRQIRRTFEALGRKVTQLHRTHFGPYWLGSLQSGDYTAADPRTDI